MRASVTLLLAFLITGCVTTPEFHRFARPSSDTGGLYIMRPFNPILGLSGMYVAVYKYPGHFRDGKAERIHEISLDVGEYAFFRLSEGFYRLTVSNRDGDEKIIAIRVGELFFVSTEFMNTSFFSFPYARLRELDRKQAADMLMDPAGRMHAHPASEDFTPSAPR